MKIAFNKYKSDSKLQDRLVLHNKNLKLNGLPPIGMEEFKRLVKFDEAYKMELDRIENSKHRLVDRIVKVVTVVGTAVGYYFVSKLLASMGVVDLEQLF